MTSPKFRFTYTKRANIKDKYDRVDHFTADTFVETMMTREMEVGGKDGTGIIGAWFLEGSRLEQRNVTSVTALIVDIDGKFKKNGVEIITPVDAAQFLAKLPFRGVAHSSHSATKAHDKFRAIYPLAKEITVEEHQRLWYWMFEQVDGQCDPAAKNPDRMFYLPRINILTAADYPPWRRELRGPVLDYDKVVPNDFKIPNGTVPAGKQMNRHGMHLASHSSQFAPTDGRKLLDAFMATKLVEWAQGFPSDVSREVWRGIAMNIGTIVNDHPEDESLQEECRKAFHEISCEDMDRYDPQLTDRLFNGALVSAREYGPMTVANMLQNGAPASALPTNERAVIVQAKHKLREREKLGETLEKKAIADLKEYKMKQELETAITTLLEKTAPIETAVLPQDALLVADLPKVIPATIKVEVKPPSGDAPEPPTGDGEEEPQLPLDEFLYHENKDNYYVRDYDGKWPMDPIPPAALHNRLTEMGIDKKNWSSAKCRIQKFRRKAPVYAHPEQICLIDEGVYTFNTYVPSKLEAIPGDWSDIKTLLMNLVSYDTEHYDFFLQWLAAPIQAIRKPGGAASCLKMGTCVVLHGDEGSGKGTLHTILKMIYGPSNVGLIGQGSLDSQFNSEILYKLFVTANEVMSSTNRSAESANKMKMWITDEEIPIEGKHVDTKLAKNTFNLVVSSNDDNPVLIGPTDRRFSVFRSQVLDREIGARLNADIKGSGQQISAFLAYMLSMPITLKYGDLCKTDARQEVQDSQMPSELKFLRALREEGWLAISLPWVEQGNPHRPRMPLISDDNIASSVLAEVYADWTRREGIKMRKVNNLWAAIHKEFPLASRGKTSQAGTQVRSWSGLNMHGGDNVIQFPPPPVSQTQKG